ncbi:MAG: class I SAM-dependent methyltransferase [Methanobacterium sp.]
MDKEKRIESKTSRTAEFTCMIRAASFYEKMPQYKSNDYIAPILVPKFFLPIIKISPVRNFFKNRFFPKGMYEYVIARTKFIDSVFQKAMQNKFDQILIFGAGFDSRGVRFSNLNKLTEIFELDAPITQNAKVKQLKNRGIEINPNIHFVSIDFNKESPQEKLLKSGFIENEKSLFILEGLTMYLDPEAVDKTFNVINKFAGKESEVVFDYVYSSVLREENLYYGESEVYKGVKDRGEPWSFGIEKGKVESFLENKDLKLIQNLNSEDLEKEFFKDENGNILSKVNGTHCIVYAKK